MMTMMMVMTMLRFVSSSCPFSLRSRNLWPWCACVLPVCTYVDMRWNIPEWRELKDGEQTAAFEEMPQGFRVLSSESHNLAHIWEQQMNFVKFSNL